MPFTREVLIRAIEWSELAQLGSALIIVACAFLNSRAFLVVIVVEGQKELPGECKLPRKYKDKCPVYAGSHAPCGKPIEHLKVHPYMCCVVPGISQTEI